MDNPTDRITYDQCPAYLCKYGTTYNMVIYITDLGIENIELKLFRHICGNLFAIYRNDISLLFYPLGLLKMLSSPCLFFAIAIIMMLP